MRKKYNKFSVWSRREAEYAEELRKAEKEVVCPDQILAPGEKYKKAKLKMPRIRSEFDLTGINRSKDGIVLSFSSGFSLFEFADLDDFIRERNILHFAFGGGLLDIEIEEDENK